MKKQLADNPSLFDDSVENTASELSNIAIQAKRELIDIDKVCENISYAEFFIGLAGALIWGRDKGGYCNKDERTFSRVR